jgi:phosphoenolpyruvate phosphomutase
MILTTYLTPFERLRTLRERIEANGFVRLLEAHNGLSAIVAETASAEVNGARLEYDGIWESSLTDTASKGLPDASIVGYESRLHTIDEILYVSSKPMVVDGDTGGEPAQFEYLVKHLERRGVSAVIIEDKVFPKRNSLDGGASQALESPEVFAQKIQVGLRAKVAEDFLVIARLESLIAGTGLQDALERADRYIAAGVDGIMIHSSKKDPAEILNFAASYQVLCKRLGRRPVLVSVPTNYNSITDADLAQHGFNIIIHANHLLRAAHKAMSEVARTILESGRSREADTMCTPVKAIFRAVGLDRVTEMDRELSASRRPPVIIPAAGKDPMFTETPKSLVSIAGRRLLDFQVEAIKKTGLDRIVVIRGHEAERFTQEYPSDAITFLDNPEYERTFDLHSLFKAEEYMQHGFVLLYSDILFDEHIIQRLLSARRDVVLALDNSYRYHKHEVDKRLDLATGRQRLGTGRRTLHATTCIQLAQVGKNVKPEAADYEFIGIAYFSARGAQLLRDKYHECRHVIGSFYDAPSFEMASVTDLLQALIDGGVSVYGLETHKGWLEIHNPEDIAIAEQEVVPSLSSDVVVKVVP